MSDVAKPNKRSVAEVLRALRQPKVLTMLALGFGSGLPFLLTGNTFGYWLRDEGASLKAIGFISWVGLAYSFKYLWAPLVDRLPLPVLDRLGRRRAWMVLSQVMVALGLLGMAMTGPKAGFAVLGLFAVITAFSSATQDIAVDAWRIESAADGEELGLMTSAFQLGYRGALIVADALILAAAARMGWPGSYVLMAGFMSIGLIASLVAIEPRRADAALKSKAAIWSPRGLFDAVIGPFIDFFRQHGKLGLLMLAAVALYRLPDFVTGPLYNPYYHDLGMTKDQVAAVRGSIGLIASVAGVAAGGLSAVRLGFFPTLILGAALQALSIAAFALLALIPGNFAVFSAVMAADNFSIAFAGVALVAYMSSLTSLGYTATQYALLSSTYAMLGKFLKGFSGVTVETLAASHGLMSAYAIFFVGAGLIGIPALLLFVLLARLHAQKFPASADAGSAQA